MRGFRDGRHFRDWRRSDDGSGDLERAYMQVSKCMASGRTEERVKIEGLDAGSSRMCTLYNVLDMRIANQTLHGQACVYSVSEDSPQYEQQHNTRSFAVSIRPQSNRGIDSKISEAPEEPHITREAEPRKTGARTG